MNAETYWFVLENDDVQSKVHKTSEVQSLLEP